MKTNKGSITEAILKASRKAAAIITVAAVIGLSFAACKDKDEEEDDGFKLPTAGDGSIDLSTGKTFAVEGAGSQTITFTHNGNTPLSEIFESSSDYEVKITNGTLSIKLKTPKTDKLEDPLEFLSFLGSASITNGLKIFCIDQLNNANNHLAWFFENETQYEVVFLFYANQAGKIMNSIWDTDLKQGWNTVILYCYEDENGDEYYKYVSGKPGSKPKWKFWVSNQ